MDEPVKPGAWYFCAECPKCHHLIRFMEVPNYDPNDPSTGLRGSFGALAMTCPQCSEKFRFAPDQASIRQVIPVTGPPPESIH